MLRIGPNLELRNLSLEKEKVAWNTTGITAVRGNLRNF